MSEVHVENVHKSFGALEVLKGVSLRSSGDRSLR